MRKINFLKGVFGVALAMLMTVGASAQITFVNDDYDVYDADELAPTNVDYVTLKTGGTTMGYYAQPDPVYHPNYVTPLWTLTADFVWDWTVPTDPGTAATVAYPVATFPANYVQITYPVVGDYEVNVAEHAPAAMGGCVDASPTVMNVTVINPPTGTVSVNPAATWQEITADAAYQICSSQPAETVTVGFNEAVPDALASYSFQITETIELLNGAGTVIATPQAETVVQDFPLASKLKGTNLGALPSAAFTTATPAFSYTFLTDALDVRLNAGTAARTRYTYRVTRSGDAAQNGFVSNISHKSDYIAGAVSYYNFTNQTVSFIVNPAPSTGPIFYVPNDFNY